MSGWSYFSPSVQDFKSRVMGVLDELRSALGETSSDVWCDWIAPTELRLKVGVASSGDPPAGGHVQAAKLVLKHHGLLDASDFVAVSLSTADVLADLARVSAVLGDSGLFARAALRTESHPAQHHAGNVRTCLWIETVRGLTAEQELIVEHAATVARGPVQVQACLGPGREFAPIPVEDVEWAPVGVGRDGRSLIVMYSWDAFFAPSPSLRLDESAREIRIAIALPDLRRDPETTAIPAVAIGRLSGRTVVRLEGPVGGRRITGSRCLLARNEVGIAHDTLLQPDRGADPFVLPNVIGLHLDDARGLLRLQGVTSRVEGSGSEVTGTDPGPSELAARAQPVVLRTAAS